MKYTTQFKISYVIFSDRERKASTDIQYTPIKTENKSITINLESTTEEEAFKEAENICNLVVNKSNQASINKEIREKIKTTEAST